MTASGETALVKSAMARKVGSSFFCARLSLTTMVSGRDVPAAAAT